MFENWESEFLQMSAYVVLTACLVQRGSAESRDPDEPPRDRDLHEQARKPGAPAILKAGAAARWLYAHSLGLVLCLLFLASFVLHWSYSAREAAAEAREPWRDGPDAGRVSRQTRNSGSNRSRTGRASSCRPPSWSC